MEELANWQWVVQENLTNHSTTFTQLAYSNNELKKGVFFDPATFSMACYIKEWGEHMLNYNAEVTTFEGLMKADYDTNKLIFIRPDDDGKSFAGEVLKYGEYQEWFERLKMIENSGISDNSKIIVGEPFNIGRE